MQLLGPILVREWCAAQIFETSISCCFVLASSIFIEVEDILPLLDNQVKL